MAKDQHNAARKSTKTPADPEQAARDLLDAHGYSKARKLCDSRRWPKVADQLELLQFRTMWRKRAARD